MRLYSQTLVLALLVCTSLPLSIEAKLSLELNCLKQEQGWTLDNGHTKEVEEKIISKEIKKNEIKPTKLELASMELIKFSYCGDGEIQLSSGEECDDGNKILADGCNLNCKKEINCHFDNECPSGYCGFNGFCDPIDITDANIN